VATVPSIETDVPFHHSFETGNNPGPFQDNWGVDYSTFGEVHLTGISGMKELAGGPSAGHGYGTYTINAKFEGQYAGFHGAALILWPGDNSWPGQELNLAEVTPDGSGRQYGTVHWADASGNNQYELRIFDKVQIGIFHDYTLVWEPNQITFKVDGVVTGIITDHVPLDFDAGGINNTIGFLNNGSDSSLTVRQVDYTPLGAAVPPPPAAAVPAPTAAAPPSPAPVAAHADTPVDWNALAAQAQANFDATGFWFI